MMPIHIFPLRRKPTRWWHIPSNRSKNTLCAMTSNYMGHTNHSISAPNLFCPLRSSFYSRLVCVYETSSTGWFIFKFQNFLTAWNSEFLEGGSKKTTVCVPTEGLPYNILVSVLCAVQTTNTLWKTKSHLQGCPMRAKQFWWPTMRLLRKPTKEAREILCKWIKKVEWI